MILLKRKLLILITINLIFIKKLFGSCPYLRGNSNSKDKSLREKNDHRRVLTSSPHSPYCTKTNGNPPQNSHSNICEAYHGISEQFHSMLPLDNRLELSNWYGIALRLAFHDAAEVDLSSSDSLGADGCLNDSNAHSGLIEEDSLVNTKFEEMWQLNCDKISRADFWVMIAKLAIESSATAPVKVSYQYGRIDNPTCENQHPRLPTGQSGGSEIFETFVAQMGLTVRDAVTLMGGHSVGHTHVNISGYGFLPTELDDPLLLNAWDFTPDKLDNGYFNDLLFLAWQNQLSEVPGQSQWRHLNGPLIMINADMWLAYPIDKDNGEGSSNLDTRQLCGQDVVKSRFPQLNGYGCVRPFAIKPSVALSLIEKFAVNNTFFIESFAESFAKMVTAGYGGVPSAGATSTGKLGTVTGIALESCPDPELSQTKAASAVIMYTNDDRYSS